MSSKRRGAAIKPKSQSTLAFHGQPSKVTKAHVQPPSNKSKQDPAVVESIVSTKIKVEPDSDLDEPTTAEASIIEQAQSEAKAPLTAEEEAASKVTAAEIKQYWREKEQARKAPRVHQENLSLEEKVCREWDTDVRYGPCMGIARIKRWKRAQKLGLKPPLEVLAILLNEHENGNVKAQRAYVDELMSSRFVET